MKARFYLKTNWPDGFCMISENMELKEGQYNEFYLPALTDKVAWENSTHNTRHTKTEAWLVITDEQGTETKLHFKR